MKGWQNNDYYRFSYVASIVNINAFGYAAELIA